AVRRDAVLLEARRALADRPGEIDARHRGALPELGLRRQLRLPERRDAERGEVAKGAHEAGRGDDLVRLNGHRHRVVAALELDLEGARLELPDPLRARRQDVDAAAEDRILERLDVPSPDADQRAGLDRG